MRAEKLVLARGRFERQGRNQNVLVREIETPRAARPAARRRRSARRLYPAPPFRTPLASGAVQVTLTGWVVSEGQPPPACRPSTMPRTAQNHPSRGSRKRRTVVAPRTGAVSSPPAPPRARPARGRGEPHTSSISRPKRGSRSTTVWLNSATYSSVVRRAFPRTRRASRRAPRCRARRAPGTPVDLLGVLAVRVVVRPLRLVDAAEKLGVLLLEEVELSSDHL